MILNNCRKADRILGLETTISRETIRELISKPCEYCGQKNERMGVDRKENSLGHIVANTVPCCIRCNALKRDMPWAAWSFLAPHVKQAIDLGLFGDWAGHNYGDQRLGMRKASGPHRVDRRFLSRG